MSDRCFNWLVLQNGQLPLRPDRRIDTQAEHRCTSALVWPDGSSPAPDNTVLVDPCFSPAGYAQALAQLAALNVALGDIGRVFVTHMHHDHMPHLPGATFSPTLLIMHAADTVRFPGLSVAPCPGHDPALRALVITAPDGRVVWMVGDAVLDEEWLRAWNYYWPNRYGMQEVIETWRSVAKIIAGADVIVPGHGPAISVTADLVRDLIESFPRAHYAEQCPDVGESLRERLAALSGDGA